MMTEERRLELRDLVTRFLHVHELADVAEILGYQEHAAHYRTTAAHIEYQIAHRGFRDSEFTDMLLELEPNEEDAR